MWATFVLLLVGGALASPYLANDLTRVRRLAGGNDVDDAFFRVSFPFMVLIKYRNNVSCGASILSPTQILTTASCASLFESHRSKSVVEVCIGSPDSPGSGIDFVVKKVVMHSRYIKFETEYDIGIVTGDSGSPLIQNGTILGMVTSGPPSLSKEQCQSGYPDIFLNVFKYLDFINQNIVRE
ncbi:hypothetical protein QAD02_008500 [Eretmocerus hayati]|uniref:Uncharacterized protein n=1 Tax=Eretmocerus hayati TaxID=131215 RepID=A0ACC2N793_9HYME|nr:hypothetical protein QAD02_008500 [Eretmocerus hayati]